MMGQTKEKYEAMSLMLQANLLLHSQDFNEARMKAEESIYVLQKIGDARGEEQGWEVIDSIERVEAERREAEQLPGIPLPVTLIFDYPSIASMGELIVETSEKQANKAAKAALK